MNKILNGCFAVALSLSMTGCATIFGKSGPQSVEINSQPAEAKVIVTDRDSNMKVFEGQTPTMVRLDKKKGYFSGRRYEVTISKPGYQNAVVFVSPKVGGWYLAGNFVFGGLIGWLIVDPATGAMWNLSPDKINESLIGKQSRLATGEIRVVLLEQVPQEMHAQMVPIIR